MVLFANTTPPFIRDPLKYGNHPYNIRYLRSSLGIQTISKVHEIFVYKESPLLSQLTAGAGMNQQTKKAEERKPDLMMMQTDQNNICALEQCGKPKREGGAFL